MSSKICASQLSTLFILTGNNIFEALQSINSRIRGMFIIHQYTDDIKVFYDNNLYLLVKRKFNFLGKMTSTFILNNEIILESTYDIFLFRKYLSVLKQNLSNRIELIKSNKAYFLISGTLNLNLKRHYLKNPIYTIENDTSIMLEINRELFGINETPIIYNVAIKCKKEEELYSLIRFLIEVPPTMDV